MDVAFKTRIYPKTGCGFKHLAFLAKSGAASRRARHFDQRAARLCSSVDGTARACQNLTATPPLGQIQRSRGRRRTAARGASRRAAASETAPTKMPFGQSSVNAPPTADAVAAARWSAARASRRPNCGTPAPPRTRRPPSINWRRRTPTASAPSSS